MRTGRAFPVAGAHQDFAVLPAFPAMKFVKRHGPNVIHAGESDKREAESVAAGILACRRGRLPAARFRCRLLKNRMRLPGWTQIPPGWKPRLHGSQGWPPLQTKCTEIDRATCPLNQKKYQGILLEGGWNRYRISMNRRQATWLSRNRMFPPAGEFPSR
jgi:hypothetical protein